MTLQPVFPGISQTSTRFSGRLSVSLSFVFDAFVVSLSRFGLFLVSSTHSSLCIFLAASLSSPCFPVPFRIYLPIYSVMSLIFCKGGEVTLCVYSALLKKKTMHSVCPLVHIPGSLKPKETVLFIKVAP